MNNRTYTLRYLGIVALFCLICVIYLGRLFFIQISGRENAYEADVTEREVTVQAVRGEIYDRNGVKLVANRYSYDLHLIHTQFFSLSLPERNEVCLEIQTALAKRGGEGVREQKYFPFEGTYPNYTYTSDAMDGDSVRGYRLRKAPQGSRSEAQRLRSFRGSVKQSQRICLPRHGAQRGGSECGCGYL